MLTRHMGGTESAMTLSFYVQFGFIVVSLAMGLWSGDGHLADQADPSLAFLFRAWIWPRPGRLADLPGHRAVGRRSAG